jgi:hypothetical protein
MVDFRRMITALAVLALFVGLASAQVGTPGSTVNQTSFTCSANVAVPPQLRAEGLTEEIGDLVVRCSGGTVIPVGTLTPIPTANFTVYLNTSVTSRLLTSTGGVSEALLLIDEPQSGLTGVGPANAFSACATPTSGCAAYVGANGQAATAAGGSTFSPNVIQGIVSGNSVTFLGIPILPPATSGLERVFRITNVRANANALGGGAAAGVSQVVASLAISGATSVPVNNPTLIAGYVAKGLNTSVRDQTIPGTQLGPFGLAQCAAPFYSNLRRLRFQEGFATSFKTRIAGNGGLAKTAIPTITNTPAVGGADGSQATPGYIYNSESNFVVSVNGSTAGLAEYGTRLKAVFSNVATGVRLFVSAANVGSTVDSAGLNPTGTAVAQMVVSETITDGSFFQNVPGSIPSSSGLTRAVVELPVVSGSATAVWEVTAASPSAQENFEFDVFVVYTGAPGTNTPAPGTTTVSMSFAPVPPAFTLAAGSAASSTLTIPRFADTSSATGIFTVSICRTILLFPYITNAASFDTGIAVSNTSTDPFGTTPQSGSCAMNFYGTNAPTTAVPALTVASGTTQAILASSALPANYTGYLIAVCNFQYGHGFGFVSDFGAQKLAMGYLALVVPDPGSGSRFASPAEFGGAGSGENLGQ